MKNPKCEKCQKNEQVIRTHAKAHGFVEESDYYFYCQTCKEEVVEKQTWEIECSFSGANIIKPSVTTIVID